MDQKNERDRGAPSIALITGPTQWELDVSGRVVKRAPDEAQAAP